MASGTTVFAFGKHRGKTFEEVASSDPGYCRWVMTIEGPKGAMKDFVDYVVANGKGGGGGAGGGGGSSGPSPKRPPFAVAGGSYAPARASAPTAGASSAAPLAPASFGGARLGEDTVLVCQLVSEQHFAVRAECVSMGQHMGAKRLPPHIWAAMGSITGAKMSADRQMWMYPMANYETVRRSLEGLGNVERIPPWVFEWVEKSKRARNDAPLDKSMVPEQLLPYQWEGLRFGWSRGGRCLIGDEMGLGKTLQALAIAAQYTQDWPILVVCPSSLRWVWKDQALQWLPDLLRTHEVQVIRKGSDKLDAKAKMWVISYSLLGHDVKKGNFQERPDGSAHGVVILDESHCIKDWKAARTKAVVPLVRNATRALLLSGTPTRNSADELHPQLCGLVPGIPAKYSDFRSRYCLQQASNIGMGRMVSKIVGVRNAAELNFVLTSTVMVRRLKKEVLTQLPEKRRQRIPIEVSEKAMKDLSGEWRIMPDGSLAVAEGEAPKLFMKMSKAKLPAVKEYLEEVLERAEEKMIIFAHHTHVMDEIADLLTKHLSKENLEHIRIDGHTPAVKRPELVKKFQEDERCRVALLSITACGEGLTMTAAGLVIFAELYWVPGAVEQAEARAHRLGSTHTKVVVEFLVVPNSPDEQIYYTLERKKLDTSYVLNGARESLNAKEGHYREPRKRPAPSQSAEDSGAEGGAEGASGSAQKQARLSFGKTDTATTTTHSASPNKFVGGKAGQPPLSGTASAGTAPCREASLAEAVPSPQKANERSKVDFLLRAAREGAAQLAARD